MNLRHHTIVIIQVNLHVYFNSISIRHNQLITMKAMTYTYSEFFLGESASVRTCPLASLLSGMKGPYTHHQQQAGLLSGAKRPCTCSSATSRFTFRHKAPVYMPTGRRPVYFPDFWVRSVRIQYTCPLAAGWFTFGREAPVYIHFLAQSEYVRVYAHWPHASLQALAVK